MSTREIIRDFVSDLRPDTWGEVCGQTAVVQCLRRYCVTGCPPKALVFIGDYGTGKSTLARLTAMSMACSGRADDDPDPCGRCDSCRQFAGSFASMDTVIVKPQVSTSDFRMVVRSAKLYPTASFFSETRRPVPVYVDDLDEHPKDHQQYLKRELDEDWCGFILAATTKPERVEPGLLDRFQCFWLQPPELSDLVPWIRGIARNTGVGVLRKDAAEDIARFAGMNHRDMLKLLQRARDSGTGFSAAGIQKAALMAGMRG